MLIRGWLVWRGAPFKPPWQAVAGDWPRRFHLGVLDVVRLNRMVVQQPGKYPGNQFTWPNMANVSCMEPRLVYGPKFDAPRGNTRPGKTRTETSEGLVASRSPARGASAEPRKSVSSMPATLRPLKHNILSAAAALIINKCLYLAAYMYEKVLHLISSYLPTNVLGKISLIDGVTCGSSIRRSCVWRAFICGKHPRSNDRHEHAASFSHARLFPKQYHPR